MNTTVIFYLCPTCFYATEIPEDVHEHPLLRVDPGLPGDERRKPVLGRDGRMLSAAPRWFLEAVSGSRLKPGLALGLKGCDGF
jgi:hypothetical protein